MTALELTHSPAQMWRAARQEAWRWQGFAARLPLFLVTALALYIAGVGLVGQASVPDQWVLIKVFAILGYAVVYWTLFMIVRLTQAWLRARRARVARFRDGKPKTLQLSQTDAELSLREGAWALTIPKDRVYAIYSTADFLFIDSPYVAWLPLEKTPEVVAFFRDLRRKKGGPKTAPTQNEREANQGVAARP